MPTLIVPDVTITLVRMTCGECGIEFAAPETFHQKRLEDHRTWYCPNGHGRAYMGKTEAERLRDQLAAKEREVLAAKSRAETERQRRLDAEKEKGAVVRSLRATRAVVTRTKKKIVAGRCPCCSHQFKDLKSHMTTRHPNYDPEKAATALAAKEG